jgi:anti-anti-sigma regulatory factor
VHEDSSPRTATIEIAGVAGLETAAVLFSQVLALAPSVQDVIVDCAKAERIDCSALQILTALKCDLESRDAQLHMRNASEPVLSFARMAGLEYLFNQAA